MENDTRENIAQTVAKIMEKGGTVNVLPGEDIQRNLDAPLLMAVPAGQSVIDFTAALRAAQSLIRPLQRKGTAKLTTLQSVIDWANRFKNADSVLYAQNEGAAPCLTCIADYHLAGPSQIDSAGFETTARHGHHRATYSFPLSKQWQAWLKVSGAAMSGVEMGTFLEDNILDVIDPPLSLTSPGIAGAEATQ